MQKLLTILLFVCAATLSSVLAQTTTLDDKAINKDCPVAEEAIDGKTFAVYDGHTIGFCCPGCDKKFLAWSTDKKDAFVLAALAGQNAGDKTVAADKDALAAPNEPYTLSTCPVSGEKLGTMGDPIVLEAEGSEVKLCCKGCVKRFKADTTKYMEVVRNGIASQQLPYYPLETCVVSGEPLTEADKDIGVDVVIGNRLFRVCCKSCIKTLNKQPGKYLAKLDAAVISSQAEHYPLTTCIVRDKSKLGSMGDPIQRVVGNRLVQFCCKGCEPKFKEDPAKFIAALDAAWTEHRPERSRKEKGKAHEHEHGEGEEH